VNESLRYALVTPARDEAENLRRLARCLAAQTVLPTAWIIVDNGSTDETPALVRELANELPWLRPHTTAGAASTYRGAPVVRAFQAGLDVLAEPPDIVVKLDADISIDRLYFERLLAAFAADPALGIASGTAYELERGVWRERHMTGSTVWGAARAYRWDCLQAILPLEARMGWDGIDALKANMNGWQTRTLVDLPFRHHRLEGERDGARRHAWAAQGRAAYYMGYRGSYLVLRAFRYVPREPAALAMIGAYVRAALAREPRCPDATVRRYLRGQQRARNLPLRMLEALGRR